MFRLGPVIFVMIAVVLLVAGDTLARVIGAIAAFATHPFLSWAGVRKWQRENRATLYYERMPLMTGGITRRYAKRSTVVASTSP